MLIAFHGVCLPRGGFVGSVRLIVTLHLRGKQLQLACSFARDRYRYENDGERRVHTYLYIYIRRAKGYMHFSCFWINALSISSVDHW